VFLEWSTLAEKPTTISIANGTNANGIGIPASTHTAPLATVTHRRMRLRMETGAFVTRHFQPAA